MKPHRTFLAFLALQLRHAESTTGSFASSLIGAPSSTYSGGSTPAAITVTASFVNAIPANGVVRFVFDKALFAGGPSTVTRTGGAGGEVWTPNIFSTTGSGGPNSGTIEMTLTAGGPLPPGTHTWTNYGGMAALPWTGQAADQVTVNSVDMEDSSGVQVEGSGSATPVFTITAGGAGVAGSDPVARFGDQVRVFQLAPYALTTLVAAPEFVIRGSVFEGSQAAEEQWFDRIVLTVPTDDRHLEIRMKKDLHERNFSKIPSSLFKTMDVTMGYGQYSSPAVSAEIQGFDGQVPLSLLGYQVGFKRLRRDASMKFTTVGPVPRECVEIAGPDLHAYVCSTPATEFHGHSHSLALKYAHLDLAFVEIRDVANLSGLLPELWGVRPMSEATRATVKKEERIGRQMPVSRSDSKIQVTAWSGGLAELTEDCLRRVDNETALKV